MDTTVNPNVYAYVGGNPVSFSDPSGNLAPAAIVAIGGLVGAISGAAGVMIATNGNASSTQILQGALIGGGAGIIGTAGVLSALVGLPGAAVVGGNVGAGVGLQGMPGAILVSGGVSAGANIITQGAVLNTPSIDYCSVAGAAVGGVTGLGTVLKFGGATSVTAQLVSIIPKAGGGTAGANICGCFR